MSGGWCIGSQITRRRPGCSQIFFYGPKSLFKREEKYQSDDEFLRRLLFFLWPIVLSIFLLIWLGQIIVWIIVWVAKMFFWIGKVLIKMAFGGLAKKMVGYSPSR
jgi:hypothetical protein